MNMKVHRARGQGEVVAVCDSDLVDRTLRHADADVVISSGFYGDRPVTDDEVREALKGACNINLFGRHAIELAKELGLVDEACCIVIDGVPHAQVYLL
ncbi:MAG: DUF424 domain-containing protein [Methanospirillum sp.]